jgi:hypothetical protein
VQKAFGADYARLHTLTAQLDRTLSVRIQRPQDLLLAAAGQIPVHKSEPLNRTGMPIQRERVVLQRGPIVSLPQRQPSLERNQEPTRTAFSPAATTIFRVSNCSAVMGPSKRIVSSTLPVRKSQMRIDLSSEPEMRCVSSNWRQVTGKVCPTSVR